MEIFIENQLIILLYSLLLGLIFGAGYDIIKIVHIMLGEFCFRGVVIFLLDLAYVSVLTAGVSVFAYAYNHGDIRMFLLLPMVAGFTVYRCTLGRVVFFFSEAIIRLIRTVIRYTVVLPLRLIGKGIVWLCVWSFRHTVVPLTRWIDERRRVRYTRKQAKRLKTMVRL